MDLFCPHLMVEATGLEPTTFWSLTKRATKLRYASMFFAVLFKQPKHNTIFILFSQAFFNSILNFFYKIFNYFFYTFPNTQNPSKITQHLFHLLYTKKTFTKSLSQQDRFTRFYKNDHTMYAFNDYSPISNLQFDFSSVKIISCTDGAFIYPDAGFLILIIGVVNVASTSDFSKDKSASTISQSIIFKFLQ